MFVGVLLIYICFVLANGNEIPGKLYSYVCLAVNDNLCFGVSPGDQLIDAALDLQLKLRMRNQNSGKDPLKLRYDVALSEYGTFTFSSNKEFCIQKVGKKNKVQVKRNNCNTRAAWFNNTRLLQNKEMSGFIQHIGTKMCLTVMQCLQIVNDGRRFCDKSVNVPVRDNMFIDTAYVRLHPCFFDQARGSLIDKNAQIFRNALDCAPNCTVNMVGDGNCDIPCANDICEKDGGDCDTNAPTPPTYSPSLRPSSSPSLRPTSFPTLSPSEAPSDAPTSSSPTTSPTLNPSAVPTQSPSNVPSSSPSSSPTGFPSVSPTFSPSLSPSASPVRKNTTSPAAAMGSVALLRWWEIVLIILGCILFCLICVWIEQRRIQEEDEQADAIIGTKRREEVTPPVKTEHQKQVEIEFQLINKANRVVMTEIDANIGNSYRKTPGINKNITYMQHEGSRMREGQVSADAKDNVMKELKERNISIT